MHAKVGWLHRQLPSGKAVVGSTDSLKALQAGCVDVLLLASEHHPIEKAELVRLAERQACRVETVMVERRRSRRLRIRKGVCNG